MTPLTRSPFPPLALALLLGSSGCAGKSALRALPGSAGVPARYSAPVEEVASVAPAAVEELGYGSPEWMARDSTPSILLASRGWKPFRGSGEAVRVHIDRNDGTTLMHVAGRPNSALDTSGRADRDAVRVVAAIDRAIGPQALVPAVGTRLRGRAPTGAGLAGEVVAGDDGRLVVQWEDGTLAAPGDARDLEILRGAWNHGRTGALVGLGLGSLVTLVGALSECPIEFFAPPCDSSPAWLIALPIGGLLGYALGRQSVTEIWSAWGSGPRERSGGT